MIRLNQPTSLAAMFACCVFGAAHGQEIQGQKGKTGAPVAIKTINVSQAQLSSSGQQGKDWLQTNGDYAQTRFYPGKQINTSNFKNLRPKFSFQTAVHDSMETASNIVDSEIVVPTS